MSNITSTPPAKFTQVEAIIELLKDDRTVSVATMTAMGIGNPRGPINIIRKRYGADTVKTVRKTDPLGHEFVAYVLTDAGRGTLRDEATMCEELSRVSEEAGSGDYLLRVGGGTFLSDFTND